jgi:anti-anti-sigma regulatory factor
MASNFKIVIQRQNGCLQFKLRGDFDGSSAFELINTLKARCGKEVKIVINTGSLSSIHPFGLGVFRKNCSVHKLSRGLTFTGKYGKTITPPKNNSLG